MRRLRPMNEENIEQQAEEVEVPSTVEEDLSPENEELLSEFQEFLNAMSSVNIPETEVPRAVIVDTTTVEEEEEPTSSWIEEEQPVPVPPAPEPPIGYDNGRLCCGFNPQGDSETLERFIKYIEIGTWYIESMLDKGRGRGGSTPDAGAWKIEVVESNAGVSLDIRTFWVNNYWAQRYSEADAIGRPISLVNHNHIAPNSGALLMDETTSRFSGAIWYDKLQTKQVILAGVGGIGSYIGFLLARMKPARLVIYDNDTVEAVNMSGQLYSRQDIGTPKVDALANMVANYADYHSVVTMNGLYTETSEAGDIMICGFDNMTARKTFFRKWEAHVMDKPAEERGKCLFIDGRLAAEELQVLAVQGDDIRAITQYKSDWLFSDSEADATVCSYKQTTFMANMIASIMTNVFVNFVANECNPVMPRDVPFYTSYAADTMYFKVEM